LLLLVVGLPGYFHNPLSSSYSERLHYLLFHCLKNITVILSISESRETFTQTLSALYPPTNLASHQSSAHPLLSTLFQTDQCPSLLIWSLFDIYLKDLSFSQVLGYQIGLFFFYLLLLKTLTLLILSVLSLHILLSCVLLSFVCLNFGYFFCFLLCISFLFYLSENTPLSFFIHIP
jgi:hypothetical protein